MKPTSTIFKALLTLSLCTVGSTVYALSDDKDQPIHVEADEAVRDEKTGLTLYRGNVKIRQGSLKISADRVTIFHIESQADKIVARGEPARIQQQRDLDSEPMHAEGKIIEYYKEQDRVHIRQQAVLEQDGSTVRSDSIEYFINKELVKAAADESNGGESQNRVQVVIPASRLDQPARENGASQSAKWAR